MGEPEALLANAPVCGRRVPEPRDGNAKEDSGEDPGYPVAYAHDHHGPAESCDLYPNEEPEELE